MGAIKKQGSLSRPLSSATLHQFKHIYEKRSYVERGGRTGEKSRREKSATVVRGRATWVRSLYLLTTAQI